MPTRDFVFRNVERALGRWTPVVRELELRTPRFSSRHPCTLLVVSHDLQKARWTEQDYAAMRCALLRLQQRVEADGRTAFVAMLVPDKLSAYHADLLDPGAPASVLDTVMDPRLHAPRVDAALRTAIEAGTVDVYLPDDTHFGAAGHAIAAEVIARYLELRPGPEPAMRPRSGGSTMKCPVRVSSSSPQRRSAGAAPARRVAVRRSSAATTPAALP